jgi:SAM-dependent methyltransferase
MVLDAVLFSAVIGSGVLAHLILARRNQAPELQQETKDLFRMYAGIEDEKEITKRMVKTQQIGFNTYGYGCISEYRFILPRCTWHPKYNDIVPLFKNSKVLDIGCCMGTDLRKMIADGLVPENACGIDIEGMFISLGKELFGDKEKMQDKFFVVNILEQDSLWPSSFRSKMFDIVYCGSVIHLFNDEDCNKLVANVGKILIKGGVFFGRTAGTEDDNPTQIPTSTKGLMLHMHTITSLTKVLHDNGFKDIEVVPAVAKQEISAVKKVAKSTMFAFFSRKQ